MKCEEEFLMDFGYKLTEARINKGLSIEAAAYEAGISKRCLSELEAGKHLPKTSTFVKLLKTYQASANYLLEDVTHERLKEMIERIQTEQPDFKFCGYTGPPFGQWDYKSRKVTHDILKNHLKKERVN